jgi:hypothetical protein
MLWLGAASERAHAHAGPQVRSIRFDREAALHAQTLLIANRGLILGDAMSASWELVCNDVLQLTTSDRPDIVDLPDGRILVATARGTLESADRACNWQALAPFGDMVSTPALTQHPSEAETLYLSTYARGMTGLQLSRDGGRSWHEILHVSDTDFLRYVRIARSDPARMYMAKLGFATSKLAYAVMRSADAGKSWQEQAVELNDTETDLEILDVSPFDPNLLLAKAHAADQASMQERLLVSRDGGKSFEEPIQLHTITQASWSDDGQSLWLATDDGLYRSTDAAHSFERVGEADLISCVQERDGALYACGWYKGIHSGIAGIGVSHDGGATFEHFMNLNEVRKPLACDAASDASLRCEQLWIDWQREILGYVPTAGSSGAAGTSAAQGGGSAASTPPSSSGGCSMLRTQSNASLAWVVCVTFAWRWRRRRTERAQLTDESSD